MTLSRANRAGLFVCALLCFAGLALAGGSAGPRYTGRVLYRSNKAPVAGVTVDVVEAEDDGKPSDEILGTTRTEPDGKFSVVLTKPTDEKVTLVVSAVRTTAETGGDRRAEGYEIKSHRIQLGYLPFPSPTKPNTVYIARRTPGRGEDE